MSDQLPSNPPPATVDGISDAIAAGIRAPLAALRASMENLARDFGGEDPRSRTLHGAVDEVVRLGSDVGSLLDWAMPPPPRPASCSLREIACAALASTPPLRKPSVLVAVEGGRQRMVVDGPMLARCASRLLCCALERGSEQVLLHARMQDGEAVLSVTHLHAPGAPATTTRTATVLLAEVLAERDARRMGGALRVAGSTTGPGTWEVHVPGGPALSRSAS